MKSGIRSHIPALDGLRGIAILLVMVYHFTILSPRNPVEKTLVNLLAFGPHGVDLFFVLSGFLITGILFDTKGSNDYFKNFYIRRVLRIFPLYYAVTLLCIAVLPVAAGAIPAVAPKLARFLTAPKDWPWYALYGSNFLIARTQSWRHPILGVTWSLAIEEQFYLVWALVVFFLKPGTLQKWALSLVCLSLASRCVMLFIGYSWIQVYVLTWCRMDGLALGSWVAVFIRTDQSEQPSRIFQWLRRIVPAVSIVMLSGYALGLLHYDAQPGLSIGYTLISFMFAAWLYLTLHASEGSYLHAFFCNPLLRSLGKYSYAIYLFHMPLRAFLRDELFSSVQVKNFLGDGLLWQIAFYVVSTAVVLVFAILSWNILERPCLMLRDRFADYNTVQNDRPRESSVTA